MTDLADAPFLAPHIVQRLDTLLLVRVYGSPVQQSAEDELHDAVEDDTSFSNETVSGWVDETASALQAQWPIEAGRSHYLNFIRCIIGSKICH